MEYETCGTSHVELREDGTYGYCTLYHDRPWREYLACAEAERRREEEEEQEAVDEELNEAYRILTMKSGYKESMPENVPEGPAVEPVDYRESAEVEAELEREEAEDAAKEPAPDPIITETVRSIFEESGSESDEKRDD